MSEHKTLQLKGLPAYYGVAEGTIVYLQSRDDLDKVDEHSIVVTDKITSEYTSAFIKAGGVISRVGGVTCHAAIICREYQVPSIVSVKDCFELFKEGEKVRINTKELTAEFI